ncbi:MAG: GH92 family glycosyl hydrolase [Bacteroidales bacterium]|nr:GH92 family glycosyl hydrolase [Bacteroidales bacterium]
MKKLAAIAMAIMAASSLFAENWTQYVDPTIGTGDHGHVFLGANVPQGMVNAGPTQTKVGWDWCSGYHESCDSIVGFAQLHLSGTGCSDLGDVALMPVCGDVELSRLGIASPFRHETEVTQPGYYSVLLDRFNINCEVTATSRVALYRFSWRENKNDRRVIVDLENGVGDRMLQARLEQVDDHTIVGYRISHGWTSHQEVYFELTTNETIKDVQWDGKFGVLSFDDAAANPLMVKVALSPTSYFNARNNRMAELNDWDFDAVRSAANKAWNKELGRIEVSMPTLREMRIFYTGMYHYMVAPQVWNDVNGDYMGSDYHAYREGNFQNYTTWSLWDTYRSAHPLATLIMRDKLADYAQTMLHIYQEQGELPVWHLMNNETYCMVGCPGVPVLADMILKDVQGIDTTLAAKAIKESLLKKNRSLHWMEERGYVPYDHNDWEPVGKSMEYFLADWAGAEALGRLGMKEDSAHFHQRSMGYKKMFDKKLQFFRALDDKGEFRPRDGFNPCYQTSDYTEGNPWQYAWLVPHDVEGLIDCYGGRENFIVRLDSLFLASSELNEEANPDITGLIGQYAHGNEPSHHIIYLYNYAGQPWKAARRLRQVMSELYSDQPAGLCGNEDVGQMSAWYILSSLGLYQVEPCGGKWQIGSAIVKDATLHVGEGKTFKITTHKNSDKNIYVQKVLLNGEQVTRTWIDHNDIVKGGTLDVYFGKKPSKWGN